uniref:Uncharacterized protein n=1 Tax=Arion vulgaris TaxID=1028688 RepID=A0A0B7BDT9_9EUPU
MSEQIDWAETPIDEGRAINTSFMPKQKQIKLIINVISKEDEIDNFFYMRE